MTNKSIDTRFGGIHANPSGGGRVGNNFALKYKTPEERKELCQKYCEHISKGLTALCFPECDQDTIDSYIEKYPEDFPAEALHKAEREGRLWWEMEGKRGTQGNTVEIVEPEYETISDDNGKATTRTKRTVIKKHGFNNKTWEFNMKNRYGWRERIEHDIEANHRVSTFIIEPDGTENKVE